MEILTVAQALSSETRLRILQLLKHPQATLTSQREGDLSDAGVCVSLIARQIGISQPTASRHLEILRRAGLIETERVAQWNYHRRDETGIQRAHNLLHNL